MRTAFLVRLEDVSGSSGTGIVGEIVQFSNGWCILFWLTEITSFKFFPSIEELDMIHSHEGRTRIVWRDEIRDLQTTLDEEDPLLEMLRSIEDRRAAQEEQSKVPPETWEEAIQERLKQGHVHLDLHITNEMHTDEFERVLRQSLEDLRALHRRMTEATQETMPQYIFDLGTHIHEIDIWLENFQQPDQADD